jgi:hypothetical protein
MLILRNYVVKWSRVHLSVSFDHQLGSHVTITRLTAYTILLVLKSPTSVWEGGAGYLGWLFYMSKFYEVVDTLIILARGKKSSTLQTYHHAGVIVCGWAVMRYESPLGLVAVLLNGGIHTLMVNRPTSCLRRYTMLTINCQYSSIHTLLSKPSAFLSLWVSSAL